MIKPIRPKNNKVELINSVISSSAGGAMLGGFGGLTFGILGGILGASLILGSYWFSARRNSTLVNKPVNP